MMNTFWVPSMAGMIYTMAGMETQLHAVINKPGRYEGASGNYSGAGFSGMKFWTYGVDQPRFDAWVAGVRAKPGRLDAATYRMLEAPSEKVRPIGFGTIDPGLFNRVVGMCVEPGVACMQGMAHGGHGAPVNDRAPQPGEAKGALTRDAEDKGTSPHLSAPRGKAPGKRDPGADANRNMTRLELPAQPGAHAAARA
jgi:cytochrome o ubiquinol oxidase subunit 2